MKRLWPWIAALAGGLLLVAGCQNPHIPQPTPTPFPTDLQLPTLPEED